jgi:hypothetical protein
LIFSLEIPQACVIMCTGAWPARVIDRERSEAVKDFDDCPHVSCGRRNQGLLQRRHLILAEREIAGRNPAASPSSTASPPLPSDPKRQDAIPTPRPSTTVDLGR